MTGEEQQQVQNIINARTKLLSEKIARQEEQISSLTRELVAMNNELESKNQEIEGLKSQLTEIHEQSKKLVSFVNESKPEPVIIRHEKASYLVSLLRQHFGYNSFRPGQEEIINALLSGRDVFCSMPAGYGKSLCYKFPALLMPGLTLVITPEIHNADLHSECLTSSSTASQKRELFRKIKNGSCKILYGDSKEFMQNDIAKFLRGVEISLVSVFAASGGEFNMRLCSEFISSLSARRIPTALFARSTSPEFRDNVLKYLRSPFRLITGFNHLEIKILRTDNKSHTLNEFLSNKINQPGIIYCASPDVVYKVRENLLNINGSEKISVITRGNNNIPDDAKFIVHYDFPENLCEYSDQIQQVSDESLLIATHDDLDMADKSIAEFCNADSPEKYLLSYIGEDERFSAALSQPEGTSSDNEREILQPEDFADFDFGNSNEAQKEAITTTNGPLLIIAGPGTGKTYTLVQRTIFLLQKLHAKPENIFIATFTNKAAKELIARIAEEISMRGINSDVSEMNIGTFHVLCERILREYADYAGLRKNFRILNGFEHRYLIMQNINNFLDITGAEDALKTSGKWNMAGELRSYINRLSEELTDPEELTHSDNYAISFLGYAMRFHDDVLAANNALSFSAMLVMTYRLLRDNPEILSDLRTRITYIMADEYQDTNYIQEQLLFMLAGERKNICVVGDDDQSIYRFRGAEVRNIIEFPDKFGKNECHIVRLMLNYRSDMEIVKFFSSWINNTGEFFSWGNFRHDKKLEVYRKNSEKCKSVIRLAGINDRDQWHEKILNMINSLKSSGKLEDYNQIAFLFRSVKSDSAQSLLQFLENNNINVYAPRSGMFFRRGEVHFALGCLLSVFPTYLKSLEASEFNYNDYEPEYMKFYRACLKIAARYIDKPAYKQLKSWLLRTRAYHERLQGHAKYNYSDLLYQLFAYYPFNKALDADIKAPVKDIRPAHNLSKLVGIIKDFEHTYRINHITAKSLDTQVKILFNIYIRFLLDEGSDEHESTDDNIPTGHVAFMTIHQAKGVEFPVVFVNSLSSAPDIDGQNTGLMRKIARDYSRRGEFEPEDDIKFFDFWRSYYVAFSRARDLLVLTCNEDDYTPSEFFENAYNNLDDADDDINLEISSMKISDHKNIYSFTSHVMLYESCPMKYKFYRELDFPARTMNSGLMGTLVHTTIEDIHKAVLTHDEATITEQKISEWFNANYENLSQEHGLYLSKAVLDEALTQVLMYVVRRGSDWSGIRNAEVKLNAVREDYILEGIVDLICEDNDGEFEITDFKAGPKPNVNITRDREQVEIYRRQLNVYAYLVENSTGRKVHAMKLYYTGDFGTNPEIKYSYDETEAEKILQDLDETVAKIMNGEFQDRTNNHDTCSDCDFRYYCGRG